jgi:hypothetical protein
MIKLEKTYFGQLYQADKLLFSILLILVLGTGFFAFRQREEFPFLLYGMCSLKETNRPTSISTLELIVANDTLQLSTLRDPQRELIETTIEHALVNDLDSAQAKKLQAWTFRYVADMRMVASNTMQVHRLSATADEAGGIGMVKREIIYDYEME